MGISTEDFDFNGPFTKDQAEYIQQRPRLVEVLRVNENMHLLDPENLVSEEEVSLKGEPTPPANSDTAPFVARIRELEDLLGERDNQIVALKEQVAELLDQSNQTETPSPASDSQGGDEFVPTDRSEWDFDDLGKEIDDRNEKIAAFNEQVENDEDKWDVLEKPRKKEDRIKVLEESDRVLWESAQGEGDTEQ